MPSNVCAAKQCVGVTSPPSRIGQGSRSVTAHRHRILSFAAHGMYMDMCNICTGHPAPPIVHRSRVACRALLLQGRKVCAAEICLLRSSWSGVCGLLGLRDV